MSSTPSSTEPSQKASSTEALARRYRHLFVLPSSITLTVYAAVLSIFLAWELGRTIGLLVALPTFSALMLSAAVVLTFLSIATVHTLASYRRVLAVLVAGETAWVVCITFGYAASLLTASSRPLSNSELFGAFVCTGIEFLVINAAFTQSNLLSLGTASIHPASMLASVYLFGYAGNPDAASVILGTVAFVVIAYFILGLGRIKTSKGFSGPRLFRSFLMAWAAGRPEDLEEAISTHSEETLITTKVIRIVTAPSETFIILPGVHPGPFYPIGSYDLPGAMSRAFDGIGQAFTLHRPGGHERNLTTTHETSAYAARVAEFARTIEVKDHDLRGPFAGTAGRARVTSTAFSDDTLLTISFAPLGSDDLSSEVESTLTQLGAQKGLRVSVVDAHNSIGHDVESPDTEEAGWEDILARTREGSQSEYRAAFSHSHELGFRGGRDLTENGVGLLMMEAKGEKFVLILADANNAVPSTRGQVATELERSGYHLIEFCTSDSHNLAARGLTTARGYYALGEDTSVESLAKLAVDLARVAEGRLAPSGHGSAEFAMSASVLGSNTIEEFARIAQSGSGYARAYLKLGAAAVFLLLLAVLAL